MLDLLLNICIWSFHRRVPEVHHRSSALCCPLDLGPLELSVDCSNVYQIRKELTLPYYWVTRISWMSYCYQSSTVTCACNLSLLNAWPCHHLKSRVSDLLLSSHQCLGCMDFQIVWTISDLLVGINNNFASNENHSY